MKTFEYDILSFPMTRKTSLSDMKNTLNAKGADGWEVGADAEVTFPEAGLNLSVNSTLLEKPVIGYVFGQDGFLVGASLEGAKYSPITR